MHTPARGFTLIELLTVIAIILIMTGVMLARMTNTTQNAQVDAGARRVLDLFRETRLKSIAVRGITGPTGTTFPGYGVSFQTGGTQFVVYTDCRADDTNDGWLDNLDIWDNWRAGWNTCGGSGIAQTLTLEHGVTISQIAVYPTQGAAPVGNASRIAVQYLRPEPTTWISYLVGGATSVTSASTVVITLSSRSGTDTRRIQVNASGLVSIL